MKQQSKIRERIFITGINGFIGSHLAIALFEKGYHVIGGDIATEPSQILRDYSLSLDNEKRAELLEYMELFVIDFSTAWNTSAYRDVKLIYHLASPIGVKNIIKNSNKTLRDSSAINSYVDKICEANDIPVVYASSSEVFGSNDIDSDTIFSVKKFSDSPRWSYAAAKISGEFLYSTGDYPSSIVRFFNVVGPGQVTDGMIIPTFVKKAKNNEALIILENGVRSYCDIREAIAQIVPIGISLMKERHDSKFNKKDYNIGNDKNIFDVVRVANKIIEIFESNSVTEQDTDYDGVNILKNRKLINDNPDLLELDVDHFTLDEILENIRKYEEAK